MFPTSLEMILNCIHRKVHHDQLSRLHMDRKLKKKRNPQQKVFGIHKTFEMT